MEDILIWVNEADEEIGSGPKLETHRKKQLHRAFSLFLYNPESNSLLLQKRAFGKYHSGGLWANTCCSHPRKGESLEDAVPRRAMQELGISVGQIQELGAFRYFKDFGALAEHELDHVFLSLVPSQNLALTPDPEEIAELRWVSLPDLEKEMAESPQNFSAWFAPAYQFVKEAISQKLS